MTASDNDMTRDIGRIKEMVRSLPEYKRYRECEKRLWYIPGLKAKADDLRLDIYRLYQTPTDDFLEVSRHMEEKHADLLSIPEVGEYLKAEAALCRRVREFYKAVMDEADIHLP